MSSRKRCMRPVPCTWVGAHLINLCRAFWMAMRLHIEEAHRAALCAYARLDNYVNLYLLDDRSKISKLIFLGRF